MFAPIIMGSKSDLEHGQKIAAELEKTYGIKSEIRVASAHKAALYLFDILKTYENDGRPKVYITIAGRSNALSAVVDANVTSPVIACPPYSDRFGGADVYSSLRLPSGVAPAVVLEPKSAALLAAKTLLLAHPELGEKIAAVQTASRETIIADDKELNK